MKKIFILSLCLFTLFITGCGCSKKENLKKIICTINEKYEPYTISAVYNIKYDEKTKKIYLYDEEEIIENADLETIETLREYADEKYKDLKKIEYFDFNTNVNNNKIVNKVKIDYEQIDKDKLLEVDFSYNNYIVDGEFKYNIIVDELKSIGAECK